MIESMVAVLLLLTILYCVRLSRQLRLLRADEQSLRATIGVHITATEIAERAIGGLKTTMREGEQTLSARLADAERAGREIEDHLTSGRDLLAKLVRITGAGKPTEMTEAPDAREVAAAAQAFADRARARISSQPGNLAA
jgi:urease gamma subunit